jgi:Protein of unknown function (DUF2798)
LEAFLPRWLQPILVSLLLSGFISLVVSGVSTMILAGINRDLPIFWLATWLPSWTVAFPGVLVAGPLLEKLVASVVVQD